jgi:hypothetical protein
MSRVHTPIILMKSPGSKRLQQHLRLQKYLICTPAKDLRHHRAGPMIGGMSESPLLRLIAPQTPHLIDYCVVNPMDDVHSARV